jgi:hypothetical protein
MATVQAAGGQPPEQGDPYLTRLVKLVPSEIVTLYLAFKVTAAGTTLTLAGWAAICLILVICLRTIFTREPGKPVQWIAVLVATVSFVLWIYATGGYLPYLPVDPQNAGLVSIAIGVWTFVVPFIYKGSD